MTGKKKWAPNVISKMLHNEKYRIDLPQNDVIWDLALLSGYKCLIALFGMSIGFVLSSAIAHYFRKARNGIHRRKRRH